MAKKTELTGAIQKQAKASPAEEIINSYNEEIVKADSFNREELLRKIADLEKEIELRKITTEKLKNPEAKKRRVQLLMKESTYNALLLMVSEQNEQGKRQSVNNLIGEILEEKVNEWKRAKIES